MKKNYHLDLTEMEWQSLKTALSNYLQVTSCFEVLDVEYGVCCHLLKKLGVSV